MTPPDHPPCRGLDPESVHQVYLSTDVRPAIRAATASQMRSILTTIAGHLSHHCRPHDPAASPMPGHEPPGPASPAGSGTHAGFQLYDHATRTAARCWLEALGFDPDQAAASPGYATARIDPAVRRASRQQLRHSLLQLADSLHAVTDASDNALATATAAQADINARAAALLTDSTHDDHDEQADLASLWDVATGVTLAITLHRHAARVLAVQILYYLWDGLGITGQTRPSRPFTRTDATPAHPN